MAGDISYEGGGGGGGYYPPSFDPNNPMGGGGYSPPGGNYSPSGDSAYYSSAVRYADPAFTEEWFANNFQAENPYTKYYRHRVLDENLYKLDYIFQSGNEYQIIDDGSRTIVQVTNNAWVDFENKATSAQQTYYNAQTASYANQVDQAEQSLVESFGNVRDSALQADIQRLADYKSELSELQFQDDITGYLNRIGDTNNAERIAELQQLISSLENNLSQDLIDYWRQQEIIKQKTSINPTVSWNYLTDPYFGRSPVLMYSRSPMDGVQQSPANFLNMSMSGELHDWFAGGALYDSPRAGDMLFNPIGNLNTTVFLGLENRNFTPDLQAVYAGAEVFRTFGRLAGDSGFSVLDFGS